MSADTYTCHRCDMTFHVVDRFRANSEPSRCAESVCRMFMASGKRGEDGPTTVSVLRSTVDAMREDAA